LNISRMNQQFERTPLRIDHGMSLPAFDLLPGIIATWPTGFGRFDALAVDDGRRRHGLSPNANTIELDEVMVQTLEHAVVAPFCEPTVDGLVRWKVVGQEPPLASGTQHVEDRVHDFAHRPLPAATSRSRPWQMRLDNFPFGIGEVTSITMFSAAMMRTGGRIPHGLFQIWFRNSLESCFNPIVYPFLTEAF